MKRIMMALVAMVLLVSCNESTNTNTPARIVSTTPIQTEIMGISLNQAYSLSQLQTMLEKKAQTKLKHEVEQVGTGKHHCFSSSSPFFSFAGYRWEIIDVWVDEEEKVALISLDRLFVSAELANDRFDSMKQALSAKYGRGNEQEQGLYFTDDTTTVGIRYNKSGMWYRFELYYGDIERYPAILDSASSEL